MGDVIQIWGEHRAQLMPAEELVYFHGAHLQHIVDRNEHLRLQRHRKHAEQAMRNDRRRFGGRGMFSSGSLT